MRKVIFLFILIILVFGVWVDGNVMFIVFVFDVVVSGDQFWLIYMVNIYKVRDFCVFNIKGFDVLMGLSCLQQSSIQIINGNVIFISFIIFIYILMVDKEGIYIIFGVIIVVDG